MFYYATYQDDAKRVGEGGRTKIDYANADEEVKVVIDSPFKGMDNIVHLPCVHNLLL